MCIPKEPCKGEREYNTKKRPKEKQETTNTRVYACAELPWISLQALNADAVEYWLKSGAVAAAVSGALSAIACCYVKFWVLVSIICIALFLSIASIEITRLLRSSDRARKRDDDS